MKKINKDTKRPRINKKVKIVILGLLFTIVVFGGYQAIKFTYNYFHSHTFVKLNVTLKVELPKMITNEEYVVKQANDELLNKISEDILNQYLNPQELPKCTDSVSKINPTTFFNEVAMKESGNNTNNNPVALHNYCKSKGKYNAIGYSPSTKFCFNDEEEAKLYVAFYVKKNCDNLTMAQCQCYWNQGKVSDSCAYSNNQLSLAN